MVGGRISAKLYFHAFVWFFFNEPIFLQYNPALKDNFKFLIRMKQKWNQISNFQIPGAVTYQC